MLEVALELALGGASYFAVKAIDKGIVEPLARRAGLTLLERTVGPLTRKLDGRLEQQGIDQDFEGMVRDWLGKSEGGLSTEQTDQIVEEVFRRWDLRVASAHCQKAKDRTWRF